MNGHKATRLADIPYHEWKKGFDAWMVEIYARADRNPPSFALDDSRESIYKGCGR